MTDHDVHRIFARTISVAVNGNDKQTTVQKVEFKRDAYADPALDRILKAKLNHYHIHQNIETDKVLNSLIALPVLDNKSKLRYTTNLLYQMLGWHQAWNKSINQQLLNSVIKANIK